MSEHARFRRAPAIAALALSGAVAAFAAMAPAPDAGVPVLQVARAEPIELRAAAVLPAASSYLTEERFKRGDTPGGMLRRMGVAPADAQQLIRTSALRFLRPGHIVSAEIGGGGELQRLSYLVSRDTLMAVERTADGFHAREIAAPLRVETAMRSGAVQSSLFAATDAAGIPDSVAIQIADIFAGDIDFHRDLRQGDQFAVIYEQLTLDGRAVRAGRVLAAEFVNQGRSYRAVHFELARGGSGYYAPDGSNLRKAFLRSPLEFSRISSRFGMRRHPFQRSWRAHTGIDYAAPSGTRVRAAGDGVVASVGQQGGYGNAVILRHRGQYSTLYAHLSRYAAGLHKGTRVALGDIIGYVGQTGWATGPHLHYEFRVAGKARDPHGIAMPAGEPVPGGELPAYRLHAASLAGHLDLLAINPLARLE